MLATVEIDRSWCHTVGYVSPIVAATVTADVLADRGGRWHGLGDRVRAGIEAAHGAGADGSRPDESIAATIAAAPHLLVIGSGVDRIAARELTLKVEEAS